MQAIILAGGFGTRLQSVVGEVPKPMAPVAGRPFLCSLFDYMQTQGVNEVVLSLHHQHHHISNYFGGHYGSITLHYCVEDEPLGTGGAIKAALDYLKPEHPVYILNGDSLVELDYRIMRAYHHASGRRLTIASRDVSDCRRYSELHVTDGLITQYDTLGTATRGAISTGFYIASPDLFEGYALPEVFSFERDFLAKQAPLLQPAAYDHVHYFIDIGIPADYERAQCEVPKRLEQTA